MLGAVSDIYPLGEFEATRRFFLLVRNEDGEQ
jgi:hypothetical protein